MGGSSYVLLGFLGVALVVAFVRDPRIVGQGVDASRRLLQGVWLELALGFMLAGLLTALITPPVLARWLGAESLWRGLSVGSVAGLLFPGGPYVAFPVAAALLREGAAPGAAIAFVTAKTLLGLSRTLTWELPLLGWQFVLARALPALLLPPLLGLLGQWTFGMLQGPPGRARDSTCASAVESHSTGTASKCGPDLSSKRGAPSVVGGRARGGEHDESGNSFPQSSRGRVP